MTEQFIYKDKKTGNDKGIYAEWRPYLYDVAFQRHVVKLAFPGATVTSFLFLVNKGAMAPADGINQKFQIIEDKNRCKGIKVSSSLNEQDLSVKLLSEVPVDYPCDFLIDTEEKLFILGQLGFEKFINKSGALFAIQM